MTKTKVYIDGSAGTTGLRINERLENREDIEIIRIPEKLRKEPKTRAEYINKADIVFLCLPDDASREAVSFVLEGNDRTVIIDASTAHRTNEDWAYGLPELSADFRNKIKNGKRIAVPGCYASGFVMLAHPLVKAGIIAPDFPAFATALSGYSGAGKKGIAQYEDPNKTEDLYAPREYALSQNHKHLKEMKYIAGLKYEPMFTPVVDDYYCGMVVSLPIPTRLMSRKMAPSELCAFFEEYYRGEKFIHVRRFGAEEEYNGFLSSNAFAGRDDVEIFVTGNEDRILVSSRFDNLGKGASGAAVQCMNIVLGCDEAFGLNIAE